MAVRILLLLIIVFLTAYNLGVNDIWQPNEAFYAETAREILEKGNPLELTYNYEPRLEKPPLTYWLTALSYTLFGIGEWQTRIVPLLSALGTALLLIFYGRVIGNLSVGVLSALIFLSSLQVFSLARYTSPEMPLTFFLTGAFIFLHLYDLRNRSIYLFLSGVFLSLALLTKGIPFIVPYLGVYLFYLLLKVSVFKAGDFKSSFKKFSTATVTVIVSSIPILGWYIYCYLHYGELFLNVFYSEVIHRAIDPNKGWNLLFYPIVILWAFLPFSLIFYYSLVGFLVRFKNLSEYLFPFSQFFVFLAIFTVAKGKIPVYILPTFPFMAILTARLLGKRHMALTFLNGISLLLMGVATFVVIQFLRLPLDSEIGLILLITLTLWVALEKWDITRTVVAVLPLLYLATFKVLPFVEKYRPYKEVITSLKEQFPNKKLVTAGVFYKDFPFYWRGKVYTKEALSSFKPSEVLLFSPTPLKGWKVVKEVKLYTGSESRFVVFLRDIKKRKRFKRFYFLVKEKKGKD
ncbi:MAG: hypothetical protein DSZ31_04980 [Gammaproteobacteria bacterium]|nr:MAG: hypothetical protein DSZ31_04980 [Gammaproteobacteria bacterium]